MTGTLRQRVESWLAAPVRDEVRAFAERLAHEAGAAAVLFYGSNLRTGSLDGVLDFYLLKDSAEPERIWPRVSYHECEEGGQVLRAKAATMDLGTFAAAAKGTLLDTTIWARFTQPSALLWQRERKAARAVKAAICDAVCTATRTAAVLGPAKGAQDAYWTALFRATYRAEFRVEAPGREASILDAHSAHFDGLLTLGWTAQNLAFARDGQTLAPQLSTAQRKHVLRWWRTRRRLGKPLNIARLIKASTTFEGAARYGAWKIERHSGVPVALTPWREKHPVLAAPRVLFDVWRRTRRNRS